MSRHLLEPFKFKQFAVSHCRSSMRVGVDAVLVGAWSEPVVAEPLRILDVGCGCGVIALMLAQRFGNALIDAIDIDCDSVAEAACNFEASPWADRLYAVSADAAAWVNAHKHLYDLIVSNPPYFNDGIVNPSTRREIARHQSSLSPAVLLELASIGLTERGVVAMVVPAELLHQLLVEAAKYKLYPFQLMIVRGNPYVAAKRILVSFAADDSIPAAEIPDNLNINMFGSKEISEFTKIDCLTVEYNPGDYTEAYRQLTKDFYLKF